MALLRRVLLLHGPKKERFYFFRPRLSPSEALSFSIHLSRPRFPLPILSHKGGLFFKVPGLPFAGGGGRKKSTFIVFPRRKEDESRAKTKRRFLFGRRCQILIHRRPFGGEKHPINSGPRKKEIELNV